VFVAAGALLAFMPQGFSYLHFVVADTFYFLAAGDFVAVTLHKFIIHMHEHVRILMCNY
jgi:hypothetical protein